MYEFVIQALKSKNAHVSFLVGMVAAPSPSELPVHQIARFGALNSWDLARGGLGLPEKRKADKEGAALRVLHLECKHF